MFQNQHQQALDKPFNICLLHLLDEPPLGSGPAERETLLFFFFFFFIALEPRLE